MPHLLHKDHLLPFNRVLTERAKALRKKMTPQERKLWYDFLARKQPRFTRQKPIDHYIVDFFCSKAQLVIEVDGSQHFTEEGIQYDIIRSEILESYHLRVLRFSNQEVSQNFDGVCEQVNTFLSWRK